MRARQNQRPILFQPDGIGGIPLVGNIADLPHKTANLRFRMAKLGRQEEGIDREIFVVSDTQLLLRNIP